MLKEVSFNNQDSEPHLFPRFSPYSLKMLQESKKFSALEEGLGALQEQAIKSQIFCSKYPRNITISKTEVTLMNSVSLSKKSKIQMANLTLTLNLNG